MSYIASWSGGKDSCFACYQAILAGYKISYLANFVSVEYKRVRFHGTEAKLIQLQAEATGIPLFQKETTGEGFEQEVKAAIGNLIFEGIEGMICGDIYLEENRALMERICGENGEYHTFVTCGPLFKKKIKITSSRTIKRDHFWFLDILEYS